MQAIILAAGLARRMQPLSDRCHKALLPVGSTTVLGRIMDGLVGVGVKHVTVVTGYRAEEIEGFLEQHYPLIELTFVRNERYESTNNIISLALGLEAVDPSDDVILIECDLLFDPVVLEQLLACPAPNVALVDRWRIGLDGTVVTLRDGLVVSVHTTADQGEDFSYQGTYKTLNIYRFASEFCQHTLLPLLRAYAAAVDENSYYEVVLGMLSSLPRHRITGLVVHEASWVEVDDPNDLAAARFRFEPDRRTDILDSTFGGHWNFDVLDFSFMANRYFPTNAMLAAMRHALPELIANYGSSQDVLNQKLAWFLRCSAARVELLHGATQIFPLLGSLWHDKRIAIPSPTFGEYPRCFPRADEYPDVCRWDKDVIGDLAVEHEVVVVVNPNSPTGTLAPTSDVYSLAAANEDTLFVVDESFLPFSDQPSLIGLLEERPLRNVLIIASLSKALGAPGLRLGYTYSSDKAVLSEMRASIPIWNVGSIAEYFLELLLKFRGDLDRSLECTRQDREEMRRRLDVLDIVDHVHPSGGDFLLVCLEDQPGVTAAALRRTLLSSAGIEVKDVSGRFADGKQRLRLAVRPEADLDRLIDGIDAATVLLSRGESPRSARETAGVEARRGSDLGAGRRA